MENRKNRFFSIIKKILKPFDTMRKVILNLIFWILLVWFFVALFSTDTPQLTGKSNILQLDMSGNIVEELTGTNFSKVISEYNGYEIQETLLWDILDAIQIAQYDPKITGLLLDLRYLDSAGLGALTEIRNALMEFRNSGKSIIAYSDYYSQSHYYLASAANEIYADPMGDFLITGFSVYNQYYGEGLERLGVDVNYFYAGKYKSYGEVFTRASMSDEAKEANLKWSGDLWEHYVQTVSDSRSISSNQFNLFIEDYLRILEEAEGNPIQAALNATLIDGLMNRKEIDDYLISQTGYSFDSGSFHRIYYDDYLVLKRDVLPATGDKIAVINASGTIYNGYESPGNIGGDSLSELIEKVHFDPSYKALVLRVDSGGGSSFASEIVRRKLELLREAGVPVVISMGSVAASGGYWISAASDEIWAQPTTITGSIGVFSLLTTFEDPLQEYLGINVDGVGTTWLAGTLRSDRKLDPRVGRIFQSSVDHIYTEFLRLVSKSRKMDLSDVHEIAQGRVWSGTQARDLGLVDQLGGLYDAVDSAAFLASLEEGEYSVEFVRQETALSVQMLNSLMENSRFASIIDRFSKDHIIKKLNDLERLNDPSGIYALSTLMFQ